MAHRGKTAQFALQGLGILSRVCRHTLNTQSKSLLDE